MKNNFIFLILLGVIFLTLYFCTSQIKGFVTTDDNTLSEFTYGTSETSKIPNIIWTFWEGDKMDVVEKCIESWKFYNPSYKVVILNKSNYREYIDDDIDSIKHGNNFVARFSDYVRICVLAKYGGFWVDASIICHHPFTWLHGVQKKLDVELVGYYLDGLTLKEYKPCCPVIENWFFACIPNSIYMTDWKNEFLSTKNYNTIDDYLKNIEEQKISTQKIGGLSNYLAMHIAAQKIMQTNRDKYNICLFSACNGPFKPLCENGWDSNIAIDKLTNKETRKEYYKYPFIKLRGGERDLMNKTENMNHAFSNLTI
jgi:hypothetical protein